MDTKLKKCKVIVSFMAFVLGMSLLLNGIVKGVNISYMRTWKEQIALVGERDYQNTEDFRRHISQTLGSFLAMASGGPLSQSWGWYEGDNYYESYSVVSDVATEETVSNITIGTNLVENKGYAQEFGFYNEEYGYGDYHSNNYSTSTPAENKKMAEKIHNNLKYDKNLLYSISYDNQILYTNTEKGELYKEGSELPEGYNFLLYFDGGTVTITKDGKVLDIYGDGYYKNNSKWRVPGYKNFTVNEESDKALVSIAVAKIPMIYLSADYKQSNSIERRSAIYQINDNLEYSQECFWSMVLSFFSGIVLLGISLIFYKYKSQGDKFLARITGKLWYEVKVILLFLLLGIIASNFSYIFKGLFWYDSGLLLYIKDLFRYFGLVFLCFWSSYLFINDWHYNKKPWEHGLISNVLRAFQTKGLKMPFQKRMMNRYIVMFFSELGIVVIGGILIVSLYQSGWISSAFEIMVLFFFCILLGISIQIFYLNKEKVVFGDVGNLIGQIKTIRGGNLVQNMDIPNELDLQEAAKDLNDIQQGMNTALEERMNSERMKVELVSNVSHDIKTPLTSIISYVELLDQEENLPEHIQDYIQILKTKSDRLKGMVQDVFEVSKAASGQLPVNLEELDFAKLLHQTLADMAAQVESSNVTVKEEIPEEAVMIQADGQRLYRVFQNLLQNALQYSLQGSRVFVTLKLEGHIAVASVKNTSESEISNKVDFTERFTRGDGSRSDGGSGLGLSIAKSFTEACGGNFQVEINADLFVVKVKFEELH